MEIKNLVFNNSKNYFIYLNNPLYNKPNINSSIFLPLSFKYYFFIFSLFFHLSLTMEHEQTHILYQPLPATTTTTTVTHNPHKSKPRPKPNHKPTTPISQPLIQPCHNQPPTTATTTTSLHCNFDLRKKK